MSLMGRGGGGGGGGGFGGFPYRSSHQQGTDGGAGRGRGRGRRRRPRKQSTNNKRHNNGPLLFGADLLVPSEQRGCLIGRGGRVVRNLTRTTGARIHVPPKKRQPAAPNNAANADNNEEKEEDDDRPVYVKSATIASLLHALWRIAGILTTTARGEEEEEPSASENDNQDDEHLVECRVRLPNVTSPIPGHLTLLPQQQRGDGSASPVAFLGLQNGISAYCIEMTCAAVSAHSSSATTTTTTISESQVDTLVDNERFAHPDWTAEYTVVVEEEPAV